METARNAARQGGAYGGDVARELEYRLAVVTVWYITWPTAKNWHTTPTTPAGPGSQIQLLLREDNLVDFQSSPHPCTTPVAWSGFARAIPTTWTRPAPYSSDGTGHMIHRAIWGGYAMIEKYVSESGSPRVYCEE